MSVTAVFPGSFDPIHVGHLDIVARAAARFDRVVVAVLENPRKRGLFATDERIELIEQAVSDVAGHVEVDRFQGLLVDYCAAHDIGTIVKGLRGVGDLEYELQMAQMNRQMSGVETLFLATSLEHAHLSSSLIKEIAHWDGPIAGTVPPPIEAALRARYRGAREDADG